MGSKILLFLLHIIINMNEICAVDPRIRIIYKSTILNHTCLLYTLK